MIYDTKYDVGDKVWVIHKDKVVCLEIKCVNVYCYKNPFDGSKEYKEGYILTNGYETLNRDLECIFETKEMLLQSL